MADDPITIRAALDMRPEDAIRAFRQRDELAVSYGWRDLEPEEHARAFTVAKVFKLDLLAELGGSLDTALKEGQTLQMWRDGLGAELQGFRTSRLQTIFRTNMRVSRAAGQWARIQGLKEARPFLRYSAILDRRTRPTHARWHGIIRPVDDPIWQTIYPPNGFNCFLPGTHLLGRPVAGARIWHDGPAIELVTAAGRRLSVTAEHPILTGRGWVHAQQLVVGDNLLHYRGDIDASAGAIVDDEQAPTRAEEMFQSLAPQSLAVGQAASDDLDHHLRADNCEACAVTVDGKLQVHGKARCSQGGGKIGFHAPCRCAAAHPGERPPRHGAARQGICTCCDPVGPGLAAADTLRNGGDRQLAVGSEADDTGLELGVAPAGSFPGGSALALDPLGRLLDGFPLQAFRLGSPAEDHALFAELAAEGRAADAGLFGQLLQTGAGRVTDDQVIDVRQFDFRGHVYDFQTASGLIVAEGLVTHNCRCQVQQLSERDMARFGYRVTPDADLPELQVLGETLMGGRIRPVLKGVDEGWDYNPGAASFAGLVGRAAEVLAKARAAGLDLAAAEVREAIVAELEKVLGRTLALALLA